MDVFPLDDIAPIEVDGDIKSSIDELVGAGMNSCIPVDAPPLLTTRAAYATSHTEPDDSGANYNNNVTSAEELRWDGTTNPVVYDSSLGANQPYVDVLWAADQENSKYGDWYADHDLYYVYLEEQDVQIDQINITLSADYGTSHSGDTSWDEFGLEMTVLTGHDKINQVERNQIKSRQTWWSGYGPFVNNILDTWEDTYGSFWTSMVFSPPYSGDFYIWVHPMNMTTTTYGSGLGHTSYPPGQTTHVWYNISVEYSLKSGSGNYAVGKGSTDDLKDDDPHTVAQPWGGHIDRLGTKPSRDSNLRRVNATDMQEADLPKYKEYVNEMIDHNDWFNFTEDVRHESDPNIIEEVNASIECYDNFVIGVGAATLQYLFFSITYIEVWHHDPVSGMYWYNRSWGVGYELFVDSQSGEPLDWSEPYTTIIMNGTSDQVYTRIWTDLVYWDASNGGIYFADMFFDVFDAWGFYNLTTCNISVWVRDQEPVLRGGSVDPTNADVDDQFTFNVTYYDANDDPPRASMGMAVNIDGTLHQMQKNATPADPKLNDGDYKNGEEYVYKHKYDKGDALNKQNGHQYSFVAYDITNRQARGDVGIQHGPIVQDNEPPTPVVGWNVPIMVKEDEYNDIPLLYNMSNIFTDLETPYELTYQLSETADGDWQTEYDCDTLSIELLTDNMMQIYTKKNMHGKVYLHLNATDPPGAFATTEGPIEIIVGADYDAPEIISIDHNGKTIPVIDGAVSVDAMEGEWCNFTINAFDVDGDYDLYFDVENRDTHSDVIGTDVVDTAIDAYNFTGDFAFKPLNRHVGQVPVNISVSDDNTKTTVMVLINVENSPSRPTLDNIPDKSVYQFKWLNFTVKATDPDQDIPGATEDLTYSCNLTDSIPIATKGTDWDLDAKTGKFWFNPVDQEFVGYRNDKMVYYVRFRVTDMALEYHAMTVKITVVNEPEPPLLENFTATFAEDDPDTPEDESLTVIVSTEDALDPDGDEISYQWDFGDLRMGANGQEANHTYDEYGEYTVTLTYSDSVYTESISKTITILEDTDGDGLSDHWELYFFGNLDEDATGDFDNDGETNGEEFDSGSDPTVIEETYHDPKENEPVENRTDNKTMFIVAAVLIAIVVLIIIAVIAIILIRGRKEDEEIPQPTPIPDPLSQAEQEPQAYPAEMNEPYPNQEPVGLEPMPEPLPLPENEDAPLELPPGPEGIMEEEADIDLIEPTTPETLGEDMEAQEPESQKNLCPTCGFPVRPGWFLCPECKNPLS